MEVYDTESLQWFKFNSIHRFRFASWADKNNNIYMHGGFENESPYHIQNDIQSIDVLKLFTYNKFLL